MITDNIKDASFVTPVNNKKQQKALVNFWSLSRQLSIKISIHMYR